MSCLNIFFPPQGYKDSLKCYLPQYLLFIYFTFSSTIHLELIFVYGVKFRVSRLTLFPYEQVDWVPSIFHQSKLRSLNFLFLKINLAIYGLFHLYICLLFLSYTLNTQLEFWLACVKSLNSLWRINFFTIFNLLNHEHGIRLHLFSSEVLWNFYRSLVRLILLFFHKFMAEFFRSYICEITKD